MISVLFKVMDSQSDGNIDGCELDSGELLMAVVGKSEPPCWTPGAQKNCRLVAGGRASWPGVRCRCWW